jgi:hypothetical protein
MRTLGLALLGVAFCVTAAPTNSQQSYQLPKDGNGLLEYCSHLVNALDSPSSQFGPVGQGAAAASVEYAHNTFEQGWCAAHLQTMREMIIFWQIQVAKTIAFLNGETNPSAEELNQVIAKTSDMTCIPKEVGLPQMGRVLVKWLRDHPERLHEPTSILSVDAFHSAFPCAAPGSPTADPAPAKP